MPYYLLKNQAGITDVIAGNDGYSIGVRWTTAYPVVKTNKIAYHIYYSTLRETVFSEGVKFIALQGTNQAGITDFSPGDTYWFAVRAVEYDPNVNAPATLSEYTSDLYVYPKTLLSAYITATDTSIPIMDVDIFPSFGIIRVGHEFIRYTSKNIGAGTLELSNSLYRGYGGTTATSHTTDGYDGIAQRDADVVIFLGEEEENSKIFQAQCRFDLDHFPYTESDGYRQRTTDLLRTDLTASDEYNVDFPSYDYAGWHRTDPVQLLNGECVGSYIGGEQFCADGYTGVGRVLRGMSVQDQNNQRQEMLLSVTGQSVVLVKRQVRGITCSCYLPSSENPDDRCPRCFPPGTMVRTESGYSPIETIKVGDNVLSSDGYYYPVTKVFENDYKGKLKSIVTNTTTRPILATPEHPFKTIRGSHYVDRGCGPKCTVYINNGDSNNKNYDVRLTENNRYYARVSVRNENSKGRGTRKVVGTFDTRELAIAAIDDYKKTNHVPGHMLAWDEAENIKTNDWLVNVANRNIIDLDSISIPKQFCKNTNLGMKRLGSEQFLVDDEFLWMVGLYLAEGSGGKRHISFALHKKEVEYQNRIMNLFKKYGYSSKIRAKKNNDGVVVEVYGTSLSQWFPCWLGKGCQNKRIPEEFMSLPPAKLINIINGINDGDGAKTVRENEVTQTSEILALQMVEVLQRCGKQPLVRLFQNTKLTSKGNKRKLAYVVNWENDDFHHHNRRGRWDYNDNLLTKVKNVGEIDYDGKVYNLEVAGDHTYVVQNVLVHNCHGTGFVVGWEQYYNPRRSDGRIIVRFSPVDDKVKLAEAGFESDVMFDCWTLTVPSIKDRDFIIKFDQDGNEEFRYEVLSTTRNVMLQSLMGGQKFRVQRVRKTDPIYQVRAFRDTSKIPAKLNTSIASVPGILPHSHIIVVNEKTTSLSMINQITSISGGHSHDIIDGVVQESLGHSHDIIIL